MLHLWKVASDKSENKRNAYEQNTERTQELDHRQLNGIYADKNVENNKQKHLHQQKHHDTHTENIMGRRAPKITISLVSIEVMQSIKAHPKMLLYYLMDGCIRIEFLCEPSTD